MNDQYHSIPKQLSDMCEPFLFVFAVFGRFWRATVITHSQQKLDTARTILHIIGHKCNMT